MFRFSLREILLLTVATGMAVGWWLDHRQLGSQQQATASQLTNATIELKICDREVEHLQNLTQALNVVHNRILVELKLSPNLTSKELQKGIPQWMRDEYGKARKGLR